MIEQETEIVCVIPAITDEEDLAKFVAGIEEVERRWYPNLLESHRVKNAGISYRIPVEVVFDFIKCLDEAIKVPCVRQIGFEIGYVGENSHRLFLEMVQGMRLADAEMDEIVKRYPSGPGARSQV